MDGHNKNRCQCFFQDFDEGGGGEQKYVNSNFRGACNRGAKRLMTHFEG